MFDDDEEAAQHEEDAQNSPNPADDGDMPMMEDNVEGSVAEQTSAAHALHGARAPNFSITERAPPKLQPGSKSVTVKGGKKVKRPLHRAGPSWRLPGQQSSTIVTDAAAYLCPDDAELTPAPRREWSRLIYGVVSLAAAAVEDPWTMWGPSAQSTQTQPLMNPQAMIHAEQARIDEAVASKQSEVKQRGAAGTGREARAAVEHEVMLLKALKQQLGIWSHMVNSRADALSSTEGSAPLVLLPDPVIMKTRTKRQTRSDIRKFEREQRKRLTDREEIRRKKLRQYLQKVMTHREDFFRYHRAKRNDLRNVSSAVKRFHENRDKRVEKEKDNEERMRLLALKNNDMDEYIRLVERTRNERLSYLIQQTDAYIQKVADLVRQEQEKAGGGRHAEWEWDRGDTVSGRARTYYANTHRQTEEVAQPLMLRGGELKEYQIAGLQWLVSLYNNNLSGILADEMGLGKTIQTISLLTYVMEVKGNLGPFLIVVPLSTMSNWVNEFKKWAPDVILVQYKGSPDQRKEIYREELESGQYNVLLTTYDYVMKDKSMLKKIPWEYIIVDEGHRMKNAESKFAQTLGTYYVSKRRVLLTGTPLQNNLPELWSLLNFLLPTIFESPDTFDQWFNKPFASFQGAGEESFQITEEEKMLIIQRLHELLRPFMLRRVKSAVLGQLPTKVEKVLKCELSGYQHMLYKDITNKCLRSRMPGLGMNNLLMQLRKCCNHPFLFQDQYTLDKSLVSTSGKLELLDRILPKLKAAGHRVLLFSQMTQMLDILEDYFTWRGFRYLRLDGQTSADDREERMYQFNAPDSPYFIFALSTRAGGLGLNLATADTVIFYDSDWNPQMDSQAMDRAHRIGQKNDVRVFRLITNTAIEEKIIARANEKSKLTNLVVEAGKFHRDSKDSERRAMVESLLRDAQDRDGDPHEESTVPDDEQLNDMMACSKDELELYTRIDEERERAEAEEWERSMEGQGLRPAEHTRELRLSKDVPDWAVTGADVIRGGTKAGEEGDAVYGADDNDAFGLGTKRKRKEVQYTDNMTEHQWMKMMEGKADEEDRIQQEKKTKRKRQRKSTKQQGALPQSVYEGIMRLFESVRRAGHPETAYLFADLPEWEQETDDQVLQTILDLKTIKTRIASQAYDSLEAFKADFTLVLTNAVTSDAERAPLHDHVKQLRAVFEREYELLERIGEAATSAVNEASSST